MSVSGRPIRVLLVAPSLGIVGGQSVQAARLLSEFENRPDVEVTFQPLDVSIGPFRKIPYVRTVLSLLVYCLIVFGRAWRYDVLHVFTASYWSYALWTLPALFAAKLYGRKIVLNYRDGQCEDHLKTWRLAAPTIRMMDAVVAPSGYLVEVFARYGIRARSIFNIIDRTKFRYRERKPVRPAFLHNRMLEPLYDVPTTLRAFQAVQREYPEASLVVAHDGPLRGELERLARELGLKNCRFIGHVSQARIVEVYDQADIYLTSPVIDCMPGSLLECYASGLVVVATAAGGIPYIADNGRTALLFPCGDPQAMAQAALRLLREPETALRIARAAYEDCARYSAPAIAGQWVALYRELLGQTAAASDGLGWKEKFDLEERR